MLIPLRAFAARLVLIVLTIACAAAVAATGRVTLPLLLSMVTAWALPLVGVQVALALLVIGRPAARTVGLARGLDLFFATHGPWSLWLLAFAAWAIATSPIGQPVRTAQFTAIVPLAWTARLIYVFHREVLRCDARAALRRTALHQALTWGIAAVVAFDSLWPRGVGLWERWFGA